ncbi:hypothetical protein ABBQ32_006389 [Trebouxia sp. C0010 RCD-2024]
MGLYLGCNCSYLRVPGSSFRESPCRSPSALDISRLAVGDRPAAVFLHTAETDAAIMGLAGKLAVACQQLPALGVTEEVGPLRVGFWQCQQPRPFSSQTKLPIPSGLHPHLPAG